MGAHIDDATLVSPLLIIDRFRAILVRLGLDDEPASVGEVLPVVLAQLARAVDDRYRHQCETALRASERGDHAAAETILRDLIAGQP